MNSQFRKHPLPQTRSINDHDRKSNTDTFKEEKAVLAHGFRPSWRGEWQGRASYNTTAGKQQRERSEFTGFLLVFPLVTAMQPSCQADCHD